MKKLHSILGCVALFLAAQTQAGIIFSFTESGGNVLMQASGTLNTGNLMSFTSSAWGGVGVETNASPQSDIMGDTSAGNVDTAFGFSAGTDLSAWIGDMFTNSNFSWSTSGTTQFTTYYQVSEQRTPGIGIAAADMVGALWTPDNAWSKAGTFASLGLTPGDYTITDFVTSESISIQIGERQSNVPSPTTIALLGLGLAGLGWSRRKKV